MYGGLFCAAEFIVHGFLFDAYSLDYTHVALNEDLRNFLILVAVGVTEKDCPSKIGIGVIPECSAFRYFSPSEILRIRTSARI